MDRQLIRARLAQVERHVAEGVRRVAEQRALVARLERGDDDASEAKRALAIFEISLAVDVADRDWLVGELARRRSGRGKRRGRQIRDSHRTDLTRT
jgi:hypothetical protein